MDSSNHMTIEDLGLSDKCLVELKRVGFTMVEEVIEFLEMHSKQDMILQRWIPQCFDEIMTQLKQLDYWSEKLEQSWPSS